MFDDALFIAFKALKSAVEVNCCEKVLKNEESTCESINKRTPAERQPSMGADRQLLLDRKPDEIMIPISSGFFFRNMLDFRF